MSIDDAKTGMSPIRQSKGPISSAYSDTLNYVEKGEYDKQPILRPSAFPTCSILSFIAIGEYNKYKNILQDETLFSHFFTSVGTTVHETVQTWTGKAIKLLADWRCTNLDCERSECKKEECDNKKCKDLSHAATTRKIGNICKKCSHPMEYNELEVEHGIITGHVDVILSLGSGKFWAGDYKTCSLKKLEELKSPPINYIYQILTYAYILKVEYDIDIKGFSIFYIARDNPTKYLEFPYDFDSKAIEQAKKLIKEETVKYKSAQSALKFNDIDYVIDTKPCKSKLQYDKLFGSFKGCPFVDVCFGSKAKLKKEISKTFEQRLSRETVK